MFENPRRGRQARNFTTNVPKILHLKSSSEQKFSENWRWVPLSGFHTVDSRFKKPNSGFLYTSGKPDSSSWITDSKPLDSGFHKKKLSRICNRLAQLGGHWSAEWKVEGSNSGQTNSHGLWKTGEIMLAVIWDLVSVKMMGGDGRR